MSKYILAPREIQIGRLLVEGKTRQQIAEGLGIHPKTVSVHKFELFRKTGLTGQGSQVMKLRQMYEQGELQDDPATLLITAKVTGTPPSASMLKILTLYSDPKTLSHSQIAHKLGIDPQTAANQLYHACKRLGLSGRLPAPQKRSAIRAWLLGGAQSPLTTSEQNPGAAATQEQEPHHVDSHNGSSPDGYSTWSNDQPDLEHGEPVAGDPAF